jgi:PhnB protein
MAVKPIPEGRHTVTPYLMVEGAGRLIDFVKSAFHAKELERHDGPGGAVMHAEVRIGDSVLMLADANEKHPATRSAIHLYVNDVDATHASALKAGAVSTMAPATQFYGDRSGGVRDAFGNTWWIATHVEDVPPAELERRMKAQKM